MKLLSLLTTNNFLLMDLSVHTPKHSHIISALQSLHWLKVMQRIGCKKSPAHNLLHKSESNYTNSSRSDPLVKHAPLPSSVSLPLIMSRLKFSDHSLCNSSHHLWNSTNWQAAAIVYLFIVPDTSDSSIPCLRFCKD